MSITAEQRKHYPKFKAKTAYGRLAEIRRAILEEPARYYQGEWMELNIDARNITWKSYILPLIKPACGTVACVGGWTVLSVHPEFKEGGRDVQSIAGKILGLNETQQDELFGGSRVKGKRQTPEHAQNGARHIARFMRKYSRQLRAKRVPR